MSPQPKGRGNILLLVLSVHFAHCLLSISWTNKWILTKLAQTHYWEGGKKWLDFGDLVHDQTCTDTVLGGRKEVIRFWWPLPHFQGHFQILTKKSLSASYLLNQMTDSGQTSYIVMLGWFKDLLRFYWPWPNFQVYHTIKTKNEPCLDSVSWTSWWILTKLA